MFDWKALGKNAAKVTLTAILQFVVTFGAMLLMGALLAGLTVYFLRDQPWIFPTVGGIVAFAECAILGFLLAGKRAITMATVKGLTELRLGRAAVRLLFERILKIREEEPAGERGNVVTRTVERLPLAQAQQYAQRGISSLLQARPEGGVRQMIQKRVLGAVEKYTLARFREEDATEGGVNLKKVQLDLEDRIDLGIAGKMRAGVNFWTLITFIGIPLQVAVTVIVALMFLHHH